MSNEKTLILVMLFSNVKKFYFEITFSKYEDDGITFVLTLAKMKKNCKILFSNNFLIILLSLRKAI